MAALMCGLTGCKPKDTVVVTGKVTVNGTPLEQGTINFIAPTGSAAKSASGKIINGEYTAEIGMDKMSVAIMSKVTVKNEDDTDGRAPEITINTIPPQFNQMTTLSAEITKDNLVHDFNLEFEE